MLLGCLATRVHCLNEMSNKIFESVLCCCDGHRGGTKTRLPSHSERPRDPRVEVVRDGSHGSPRTKWLWSVLSPRGRQEANISQLLTRCRAYFSASYTPHSNVLASLLHVSLFVATPRLEKSEVGHRTCLAHHHTSLVRPSQAQCRPSLLSCRLMTRLVVGILEEHLADASPVLITRFRHFMWWVPPALAS